MEALFVICLVIAGASYLWLRVIVFQGGLIEQLFTLRYRLRSDYRQRLRRPQTLVAFSLGALGMIGAIYAFDVWHADSLVRQASVDAQLAPLMEQVHNYYSSSPYQETHEAHEKLTQKPSDYFKHMLASPDIKPYLRGKVVLVSAKEPRVLNLQLDLPEDLRAMKPEEVQTIVWVKPDAGVIGGETLSPGRHLRMERDRGTYRTWFDVTFIDRVDRQILGTGRFFSEKEMLQGIAALPRKEPPKGGPAGIP